MPSPLSSKQRSERAVRLRSHVVSTKRGWHWWSVLAVAAILLATVAVAQALIRLHEEPVAVAAMPRARVSTADAKLPPMPIPVATRMPAAPAPTPALASRVPNSIQTAGAQPGIAASVFRSSDSLAWTYFDRPCKKAGGSELAARLAQAATAVRSISHCTSSRILALVDARPPKQSAPTAAAFSARALAVSLTAHPRLILDSATLVMLRQRATSANPQWNALKARCDSYIGGTVQYPSGNAYPNLPNIGQGYQGSDYVPALLAEGMCYQVLKTTNASAAATYGAKAVDILLKMSTSGSQGQDPCTDSGYGIRFYGVGMGLGYDWVRELLTPDQRTQVYTTANSWISAWEAPNGCADFEYAHPQSNYYAGYFHAKAAISLASYEDNAAAPAQWDDWLSNQFAKRVQPYYQQHLLGGGWPEGYANYAPLGVLNMTLPIREVRTATGADLVHAVAPYSYPVDSADHTMHFTWPSRAYFDDRDTNHSGSGSQPPGTTQVGLFEQLLGALDYWGGARAPILRQYLAEVDTATSGYDRGDEWLRFLALNPAGTVAPVAGLPTSYLAPGLGAVAARSDWGKSATWMSFRAAPYANNPAQGEEYFDQGSLALVRGGTPLLLNATGWMVHDPAGTADEDRVYTDNFGSFSSGNVYSGNRQVYNVFYVRNLRAGALVEQFGQAANTTEDNQARTRVAGFEDGGAYVYVLATGLEDMYRRFAGGAAVAQWSRQVIYLRPGRFVVYDRTTAGSTAYDQYLAWHFPASPVTSTTGAGGNRIDVTLGGQYAGAMTTVLPLNAGLTTTAMYPSSNPAKAWQVQVRAPTTAASQQWLTVFDLSGSLGAVARATPVTVNQGSIVGVQLAASDGNAVVVSSAGAAGTPLSGTISYTIANLSARHLITDLTPSMGYTIKASVSGSQQSVTVTPGGTTMSSAKGVLSFQLTGSGSLKVPPPPVSTLPVTGFPKPYTG